MVPGPHSIFIRQLAASALVTDIRWFARFGPLIVGTLFGAGAAVVLVYVAPESLNTVRMPHAAIAASVAFGLLFLPLARVHRVEVDLRTRRFAARSGIWPFVSPRAGLVSDFQGIAVLKAWIAVPPRVVPELDPRPGRNPPTWLLVLFHSRGDHLILEGRRPMFSVAQHSTLSTFQDWAAEVATALQVPMLGATPQSTSE